MRDKKHKSAKT